MFDPPELHDVGATGAPTTDIGRLAEVQVDVTVELGRTRLSLGEAMALGPGAVVPLGRLAGQPVDLMINGERVGLGEVVVVDDVYGLRITDVVGGAPEVVETPTDGAATDLAAGGVTDPTAATGDGFAQQAA